VTLDQLNFVVVRLRDCCESNARRDDSPCLKHARVDFEKKNQDGNRTLGGFTCVFVFHVNPINVRAGQFLVAQTWPA